MYTEAITNLQAAVDATPGICELLFLPVQSINKMPDFRVAQAAYQDTPDNIWSLQNSYFDLKESWKNFNTVALSIKFKENHENTGSGTFYKSSVEVVFNTDFWENNQQLLRSYTRQRWVVVVKQRNASWRMMGNLKQAARFTFDYENNQKQIANQCKFEWQSVEPCPAVSEA